MNAPTTTEAPQVAEKDAKNGVTRPKAGTQCGIIWDIADKLSAGKSEPPRKDIFAEALKVGINEATLNTQYNRWRKYNGLVGTSNAGRPPKAEGEAAAASGAKKGGGKKGKKGEAPALAEPTPAQADAAALATYSDPDAAMAQAGGGVQV